MNMVRITLDHSGLTVHERHPGLRELIEMDEKDEVNIYNSITLEREIENLTQSEQKVYEQLRSMIFGDKGVNLSEHADLCLLIKHMKAKRDFFFFIDKNKYKNLENHKDLKIRFPDREFLKEIKTLKKKK